jgi:hypothetical protein
MDDPQNFSGNAADLSALAIERGRACGLPVDPDKTNERLVRYYVAEGVVDRPDRVGRDATYGYRHLLQLLTALRMAQAGISLAVIAEHNRSALTRALEEGLDKPLPTQAELLVGSFMSRKPSGARSAAASAPAPVARPSLALPDVLDEVRRFKDEVISAMGALRHEGGSTLQALMVLTERVEHLNTWVNNSMASNVEVSRDAIQSDRQHQLELSKALHSLESMHHKTADLTAGLSAALAHSRKHLDSAMADMAGRMRQGLRSLEDLVLSRFAELEARRANDVAALRALIEDLKPAEPESTATPPETINPPAR